MTYIICFVLTTIFTYLAQKQFEKNNKSGIIFSFYAILIPSIVAGLRALDVGRDVSSYVTPVINASRYYNFTDYMNHLYYLETGYKIFGYLITKITLSPNFFLFIIQFITILFIFLFAYKNRNRISMTFVMITYLLLWYCTSLTFMRQSIAMAIIIYSITFFLDKKYFNTMILFFLAVSFHSSAFVSLVIYGLIFIFQSNLKIKTKQLIYMGIIFLLITLAMFFKEIVYFFTYVVSILPGKYYGYILYYLEEENVTRGADLILKLFCIFMTLIYIRYANKNDNKIDAKVILLLLFIDISTFVISYQIVNINRVGLYFFYPAVFYILPNVNKSFKNVNKMRNLASFICVIVMCIWWFWRFPISQWCETFPYRSDIITFLH